MREVQVAGTYKNALMKVNLSKICYLVRLLLYNGR